MKTILGLFVVFVLVLIGFLVWQWINYGNPLAEKTEIKYDLVNEVYYSCKDGKQIKAVYYKGPEVEVKPGEMPIPSGKVELILSDKRQLSLPQTISGSGIRYANSDESIIFWSKGEGAFITENNSETFSNCAERIWTLGNDQLDNGARAFLLSQKEFSWKTEEDGENFCVFQNLMPEQELSPYYLWVRCGEFKMDAGQLKEFSGMSAPIKLTYPNELSYFYLSKFKFFMPRDGSLYDEDVKVIFPEEIWDRLHFELSPLNEKIIKEAEKFLSRSFDARNSTFTIDGKEITLANGLSEIAVEGSASKITTRYFGNEAVGDLNNDGFTDRSFLITQETGGSGLFYYVVAALRTPDGGYKNTNAFLVGDRIAPQTSQIHSQTGELRVNFAERKPGEPMTARPSWGVTLLLKVSAGGVLEGLMK